MSDSHDQALLMQLADPDRGVAGAALEQIFRAWFAPLTAFARALLGDDAQAQDVVQEVLVDLWRRRMGVVVHHSLAAYLHTAVRHRVLTTRRNRSARERILGTLAGAEFPGAPQTASQPEAAESEEDIRFRAVVAAADTLPPRAREIFYLRWRQGLSYKEIAAVMGIAVKTVEAQMTIALRRVREAVRGLEPGG